MGNEKITGRMFVVGADINTDLIIPARYMTTMDPATLGARAMADLDPAEYPVPFLGPDGRSPFAVVVAGPNFGCGSSREHAPIALAAAGVRAVVAPSFARIFYRNAVNGGQLLPLEAEGAAPADWRTGDELTLDIAAGEARGPGGQVLGLKPFGPLAAIVEAGGLTAYNRKRLGL